MDCRGTIPSHQAALRAATHRWGEPRRRASRDARRRGFTLIELLVVVAVVAVLVGVLLPALRGAREAGRGAVCLSNVRQLHAGLEMYADDCRGVYAPGMPERAANLLRWHGSRSAATGTFMPEGGTLTAYIGEGDARPRECPAFSPTLAALSGLRDGGSPVGFERSCGGYGYNNEYVGTARRRTASGSLAIATDRTGSARRLFLSPAATIAFADSAFATDEAAGVPGGVIEYSFVEPRFWPQFPTSRADPSMHFRHAASASMAWLDGHACAEKMGFSWFSGLYGVEARTVQVGWPGGADDNRLFDYE